MLYITVPAATFWDEDKEEFVEQKEQTLELEHSLVSLSEWESKWRKPFFSEKPKTDEEILDYIRCMTITQDVDQDVYKRFTEDNFKRINEYIETPRTATFFSDDKNARRSREIVTSEIIFYWMIALNIPPEYREWHLTRLLALIKVCNIKNSPNKKRSPRDIMRRNKELNDARRKRYNSRG